MFRVGFMFYQSLQDSVDCFWDCCSVKSACCNVRRFFFPMKLLGASENWKKKKSCDAVIILEHTSISIKYFPHSS